MHVIRTTVSNVRKLTWLLDSWRYLEIKHFYNDTQERSKLTLLPMNKNFKTGCFWSNFFHFTLFLLKLFWYFFNFFNKTHILLQSKIWIRAENQVILHLLTVAINDQPEPLYRYHRSSWAGNPLSLEWNHPIVPPCLVHHHIIFVDETDINGNCYSGLTLELMWCDPTWFMFTPCEPPSTILEKTFCGIFDLS